MAGLFSPYSLGENLNLSHRVVLAPMTRCRALGGVPQPCHVEYYSQRTTDGGLLITEATTVSDAAAGISTGPWPPVSSTAKPISSKWRILLENDTLDMYTNPRALETSEVSRIVEEYRLAAVNSVRAWFDGIEIHGGHGYLIDQFLKESINDRTDDYGGAIENRSRFLMEIIEATAAVVGVNCVGVRISPAYYHNGATVPDPLGLGLGIIERVNELQAQLGGKLSYLHVTRPRFLGTLWPDIRGENERKEARLMRAWRDAYKGTFMSSGGFKRATGAKALEGGDADLVAYGRLFISNPDLVHRFEVGANLNAYDRTTFYTNDLVVGYTDYPFLC